MEQTLYVVCGEPGVGKSRVAENIATHADGTIIDTDHVRKDMFGPEPSYSWKEGMETYDELFNRAEKRLKDGETVILDGTFKLQQGRERANALAQEHTDPYIFEIVRVVADDPVVRRRLKERQQEGNDISDADYSVYQSIRDTYEAVELPHTTVDNSSWFFETERQLIEAGVYPEPSWRSD